MAGLPWFELDTDYHDSPKVEALKSRLRNPEADAFPSRLYAYCYRHAVDRFDPEVASHTIEAAAKWRGRRGMLFDALFAVGILERQVGKIVVHGVGERLAPHVTKRERDAARMRERRSDVAATSPRRSVVVAGDKDKDSNKDQKQQQAARGGMPLRDEVRFAQHPLAASLRQRLSEEWPGLGWTKQPDSDNAAVARCGLDACVAACLAHGRSSKLVPEALGFFSSLLADLRPESKPAIPPPPDYDDGWISTLPEPQRTQALQEWVENAEQVREFFAPERHPQALANAMSVIRQRYLT